MNFNPRLKWTVLPAGAEISPTSLKLHLSVLVSPELLATTAQGAGTRVPLQGSIFHNWPQTLAGLSFELRLNTGLVRAASPQNRGDQQLWHSFFADVTAILGAPAVAAPAQLAAANLSEVRHFSYESAHQELRSFYRLAAENSFGTRSLAPLGVLPGAPAEIQHAMPATPSVQHLRETFGSLARVPRANVLEERRNLVRAETGNRALAGAVSFYDRKSNSAETRSSLISEIRPSNVAAEQETEMDFHQWVSTFAQYPWLQRQLGLLLDFEVELPAASISAGPGYVSISANSSWEGPAIRTHFRFASSPPEFEALYRDEASSPYGCLPLGGTSYSVSQVSVDGGAIRAEGFGREIDRMADDGVTVPPALRTGPLSVAKQGLADDLAGKVTQAQHQHDSSQQNGSVDIYAEDVVKGFRVDVFDHGRWFPLCQRECTLSGAGANQIVVDEGWVSLSVTTQNGDSFLHETIFSWPGWSLVAGRPGKTMGQDGQAIDWTPPVSGKPRILVKRGPARYPAYRLDREYRFRARTVDLAGRSRLVPISANLDSRIVTAPWRGVRYEPVGAPFIIPRTDLKNAPGESARTLVIRSGQGENSQKTTERHIAPPLIDHVLAELHSLFDEKGAPSKKKYREVVRAATPPTFTKDIYWHEPSTRFEPDYTVDPLFAGVAFFGLPIAKSPFVVPQTTPNSFRLRLTGDNAHPSWSNDDQVLTVALPPGQTAKVQVASMLRPDSLRVLAMWDWIREVENAPSTDDALRGLFWALTPSRELTLIHAVQRPLQDPVPHLTITDPAPRGFDETFVDLQGTIDLDVPTTGEIELIGDYTEWLDDPDSPEPTQTAGSSHALPITSVSTSLKAPIEFGTQGPNSVAALVRQNFPDTHYRHVAYTAVARSRFKEQFGFTEEQLAAKPYLIATRTPDGSDHNDKHEKIDSRAWLRIPSTARPKSPDVFCILPLYGWCDPVKGKPGNVSRKMQGGGLRIYLQRGWPSSGDGEQLAVVLWPAAREWLASGKNEFPIDVRPFVSQWGMDPIWTSIELSTLLGPEHFLNKVGISEALHTLPEFEMAGHAYPENRKVSAVLFNPSFDKDRGLWYCDLEMDESLTYSPFVRLALARFQRYSVEQKDQQGSLIRDVHLSHAALADFVQLPSGRVATITEHRKEKQLVVTVTGLSYSAVAAGENYASVEAALETRDHNAPLGWTPLSGKTVTLKHGRSVADSTMTWSGTIPLDHHVRRGKHRVVVRETVSLPTADGKEGKRLIYADVLEL